MSLMRQQGPAAELVYSAARRWVDRCLVQPGSLFADQGTGRVASDERSAAALHAAFTGNPLAGSDTFLDKLRIQLSGQPTAVVQLAAELLYVHLLVAKPTTIGGSAKRRLVDGVLGFDPGTAGMPAELDEVLDGGIASMGQAFLNLRWRQFELLAAFTASVAAMGELQRAALLPDPWATRDLVDGLSVPSSLLQRNALLHLLFPDTFAVVFSQDHRKLLVERFGGPAGADGPDMDRALIEVDKFLRREHGDGFDAYRPPVVGLWSPVSAKWAAAAAWAASLRQVVDLDSLEVEYKREIGQRMAAARDAFLAGDDWMDALKVALTRSNNLLDFRVADDLMTWLAREPASARQALAALWESEDVRPAAVDAFAALYPDQQPGAVLSVASVLLMGVDASRYPPYRSRAVNAMIRRTTYGLPDRASAPGAVYQHWLEFLDHFITVAGGHGLDLTDRLEAQSMVWALMKHDKRPRGWPQKRWAAFLRWRDGELVLPDPIVEPRPRPPCPGPNPPENLAALADELLIGEAFLDRVVALLRDKKQIVLYGPPGTGKTFLAQKLAGHLSGAGTRTRLVQFHPSYAYEDFVEGYRPRESGFTLVDGPLKDMARQAEAQPDRTFVLVIDELNRGNTPKVLGECYFLLEYRREQVALLYSEEPFSLPDNLLIIGTMNSADRSVAMLDGALRRRFYFVPLVPQAEPVKGLLDRFLGRHQPGMAWVAAALREANRLLAEPNLAIGPSHFMRKDLDEAWAGLVWDHAVLPTVEDVFWADPGRVEEFRLDAIRRRIDTDQVQPGDPGDDG